jgi:hypothetical protein
VLSPVKHKPLSRGPCLTGPARGGLPSGRSGRRDGQPSIEHRDGSCGVTFRLKMAGAVVERAEPAQPFQSPGGVVAGDEVGDRCPDLGGGAEGSAPDCLLLEGSEEPLDDAVALRLVRKGVAQRQWLIWREKWWDVYCGPLSRRSDTPRAAAIPPNRAVTAWLIGSSAAKREPSVET